MTLKDAEVVWVTPGVRAVATIVLAVTVSLFPAAEASAQSGGGDRAEGAPFLLLPVGAQGVSLGRAMTWVEGPEGAFWNPAGLAGVRRTQGVLFHGDSDAGTTTAVTALWARPGVGSLGASYLLLDVGEQEQRDDFGNYTGRLTVRNHLGVISGATRLTDRLAAGLSFKIIRFQFSCRGICTVEGTTATTYAIDAGVQGLPTARLRLGAMVAHLGPSLQVLNAEQADPLPSRLRFAAAYDLVAELTETESVSGWLAFEVEDRLRELGSLSYYLGTELTAGQIDALSLRAGYVWSALDSQDGGRVGLGLRYERFDLSIAKSLAVSPLTREPEPVQVTLSIGF